MKFSRRGKWARWPEWLWSKGCCSLYDFYCKKNYNEAASTCVSVRYRAFLKLQGVWKKITQEILNKIRSFWCTRLIFTRDHRKFRRRWRFHSNRLILLALAEVWKNVLKLHIFAHLRIATENSSHALSPLQKIECTCFKFAVSIRGLHGSDF